MMGSAMLFSNVKLSAKFLLGCRTFLKKTTSIGRWPSSVHDWDDSHWWFALLVVRKWPETHSIGEFYRSLNCV